MPSVSSVYEFGPFRLDSAERLLLRTGQPVSLTPKAFDLLLYLVGRHGRLVTKQELLSAVWPDTFVEEANLTYTVSALRKALGDGHDGEQFIQTVPTRGYRFVAPVTKDEKAAVSPMAEGTARSTRDVLRRAATVAFGVAVLAMLPIVVRHLRETPDTTTPARFTIAVPDTAIGTFSVVAAISPDGRLVAYVVRSEERADLGHIWVRSIDAPQAGPVAGTNDATSLFWAPDSRQLAFTTASALKKLTISNGTVETLCAACSPGRGGTWSRSGMILFLSPDGGLRSIQSTGGEPVAVTTVNRSGGEVAHIAPHFLPDGHRFLYVIRNADATRSGLFVGRAGSEPRLLLRGEHPAVYAASGHLLFTRTGSIVSQPFDLESLSLMGDAKLLVGPSEYSPTPVQSGDYTVLNWFGGWPSFSASDTGVLTYAIAEHPQSQFQWVRRAGESVQLVGEPGPYMTFDLSPEGTRLAFSRVAADHANVWVHDLTRGVTSRLTFGAASSYYDPRWGPDGQWVAANRPAPAPLSIVTILPDGRESVVSGPKACLLDDVSRDGRYLLCRVQGESFGQLVAMPLTGGEEPIVVRKPPAGFIDQARFSPDSRWIAYNANESGQYEVYPTAFPPSVERWQVSHGGGVQPVWRQDGRELYYLGFDGVVNSVELRTGNRPQFSVPKRLLDTGLLAPSPAVEQYAVSADGQRVLVLKPVSNTVRNSIGVIVNWPALLSSL